MNYHFKRTTANIKTGNIPVTISDSKTCPDACPLKGKNGGCYGSGGPIRLHWDKVNSGERGGDFNYLINNLTLLPDNQLTRINVVGDLPGRNNKINGKLLKKLVKAGKDKRFYAYTHKPVIGSEKFVLNNRAYIKHANDNGFTINLSANSLKHADDLKSLNIGPVAAIVPFGTPNTFVTPAGNKGVICPAQREGNNTTCEKCQLCQKQRSVIVGFIPHGNAKNKVNQIVNS